MLSGVLKSPTAIEVNIRILRAFTAMRRFVFDHAGLVQRVGAIEMKQLETDGYCGILLWQSGVTLLNSVALLGCPRPIYKTPIDDVYYRCSVCTRNLKYYREGHSPFVRRPRLVSDGRNLRRW